MDAAVTFALVTMSAPLVQAVAIPTRKILAVDLMNELVKVNDSLLPAPRVVVVEVRTPI